MKIKEILALSLTEPLDQIAKEKLSVGKNAARDALKRAGCFSRNGVRGWHYEGDPTVLEKSLYDFVEKKQTKTQASNPEKLLSFKTVKKVDGKEKRFKKVTYEIEESIHIALKIRAIHENRNISDIVNEIFREALK